MSDALAVPRVGSTSVFRLGKRFDRFPEDDQQRVPFFRAERLVAVLQTRRSQEVLDLRPRERGRRANAAKAASHGIGSRGQVAEAILARIVGGVLAQQPQQVGHGIDASVALAPNQAGGKAADRRIGENLALFRQRIGVRTYREAGQGIDPVVRLLLVGGRKVAAGGEPPQIGGVAIDLFDDRPQPV